MSPVRGQYGDSQKVTFRGRCKPRFSLMSTEEAPANSLQQQPSRNRVSPFLKPTLSRSCPPKSVPRSEKDGSQLIKRRSSDRSSQVRLGRSVRGARSVTSHPQVPRRPTLLHRLVSLARVLLPSPGLTRTAQLHSGGENSRRRGRARMNFPIILKFGTLFEGDPQR